ncbi:MAG: GGDEF domain-containing protein [Psychrobium sp.]
MKHSNIGHRPFILSATALLSPLLLFIIIAFASLTMRTGQFDISELSNQNAIAIHSLAVLVIYAIYYGIVKSARRWITHLDDKVTDANQALDEQKKQLKLETYQHQQTNVELHKLRTQDPLTELYNQSHFVQLLHNEIARFRRYESEFSLLVIAIDNFDKIYHEYGSEFADYLIKKFADLLEKQLRESDILTRYDRNHFAIIAPSTAIDDAVTFANRLCNHIEVKKLDYKSVELDVTLSIGVVAPSAVKEVTTDNLTSVANKALHAAIEQGGNQAVVLH